MAAGPGRAWAAIRPDFMIPHVVLQVCQLCQRSDSVMHGCICGCRMHRTLDDFPQAAQVLPLHLPSRRLLHSCGRLEHSAAAVPAQARDTPSQPVLHRATQCPVGARTFSSCATHHSAPHSSFIAVQPTGSHTCAPRAPRRRLLSTRERDLSHKCSVQQALPGGIGTGDQNTHRICA